MDWFKNLTWYEHIYFWLGIAATLFLIIQIILMCFASFGGDTDIDGDGDIDVDVDSGVSLFTVKSLTAFFAVGSWSGLLTCTLASDNMQWFSIIVALISGGIAMALVVVVLNALRKLQCNGALQSKMLIGQQATVYVSVPPARGGRGKITLTAQGRFMELDAVTDETQKITVDELVEIVSTDNDCTVVKRIANSESDCEINDNQD